MTKQEKILKETIKDLERVVEVKEAVIQELKGIIVDHIQGYRSPGQITYHVSCEPMISEPLVGPGPVT